MLKARDAVKNEGYTEDYINILAKGFSERIGRLISNAINKGDKVFIATSNEFEIDNTNETSISKEMKSFRKLVDKCINPTLTIIVPFVIKKKVRLYYVICFNNDYKGILKSARIKMSNYILLKYKFKFESDINLFIEDLSEKVSKSFCYTNSYATEQTVQENQDLVGIKLKIYDEVRIDDGNFLYLLDFITFYNELNIAYLGYKKPRTVLVLIILTASIAILYIYFEYYGVLNCMPPKLNYYNRFNHNNVIFDYKKGSNLSNILRRTEYFLTKNQIYEHIIVTKIKTEILAEIGACDRLSYWAHYQLVICDFNSTRDEFPTFLLSHEYKDLYKPYKIANEDLFFLPKKQYMDRRVTFNFPEDLDLKREMKSVTIKFINKNRLKIGIEVKDALKIVHSELKKDN